MAIRRATESGGNFEQEGNLRRGWTALVSHDEDDGGRQFLSHKTSPLKEGDAVIVSLRKILRLDPSIAELTCRRDGAHGAGQRIRLGSVQMLPPSEGRTSGELGPAGDDRGCPILPS
jgi:hypothetical protein